MGLRLHKHFGHIVCYVKIIWVCNFINDLTPLWAMWNTLTTIGDALRDGLKVLVKNQMGLRLHKYGPIVCYVKIIWVCNFINDLTPLWAMWNALTTIGDAFCLDRGADWQGWEKRVSPLGSSAWLWLNKSWVNCLVFYCKVATDIIRLTSKNILW